MSDVKQSMHAKPYNYRAFDPSFFDYSPFFNNTPGIGECAIDFEATTLDGNKVKLSDFQGKRVVLETGSISCPMYMAQIDAMNRLAEKYPDVIFLVLYIREAHPGSQLSCHLSMQDKLDNAAELKNSMPENRLVLVDSIEGDIHRAYGGLPDMSWVFDEEGRVIYKLSWNHPPHIDVVLSSDDIQSFNLTHHREPSNFRPSILWQVFKRNGWSSVLDILKVAHRLAWQHLTSHGIYRQAKRSGKLDPQQNCGPCFD